MEVKYFFIKILYFSFQLAAFRKKKAKKTTKGGHGKKEDDILKESQMDRSHKSVASSITSPTADTDDMDLSEEVSKI